MSGISGWQEVESKVYRPGRWIIFSVGTLFLLTGIIGFLTIGGVVPAGMPSWIAKLGAAAFALLGGLAFTWAVSSIVSPTHIRHAAPNVLPNVPKEPVIREGSVVHGRLTHELWEDVDGWQFRPAGRLWRNDKGFLLGFGIPFMVLFAGLLTWVFHSQIHFAGWSISAVCAVVVTVVCGGSAFLLAGMVMRSGYRRLSRLEIPRNGGDLELDSPEEPSVEQADVIEGLKWAFLGETNRQQLSIPRNLVGAVQLCPWKYVVSGAGGREITWAVQGLLVLASPEEPVYHRLPLLLTSDFVGAAQVMQKLAQTLRVPYLFCADAEGWKAEAMRSRKRPPLRIGGSQN